MINRNQQILFREMVLDLRYRIQLADDLFCNVAESFISAATLEEWSSRSEFIRKIREYSQALQIINEDMCRVVHGKHTVFPADLSEWIFDSPDGEAKAQIQLERLHAIGEGLQMVLNSELLHGEFADE